jgi:GT2 family glycosyltransferase
MADLEECRQSVVVVTWRRPQHVATCLAALAAGRVVPEEIVVVDASEDEDTARVVEAYAGVRHVRFPGGAGHMTTARNEGLLHVRGEVISFLDDDVRVGVGWAEAVQLAFTDPSVAAASGRVVNGDPGEEREGVDRIGRLLPDGTLTGYFAADPGRVVHVDHGIGANMSFRRSWMARLGGFRDVFPGTAMREDTDVFLRIRALGGRAVFVPGALVDNDSGPHVVGRRFDLRYAAWGEHNHLLLLVLNFGLGRRSLVWRYVRKRLPELAHEEPERRTLSRVARVIGRVGGVCAGIATGAMTRRSRRARSPRTDRLGHAVTSALSRPRQR